MTGAKKLHRYNKKQTIFAVAIFSRLRKLFSVFPGVLTPELKSKNL